jgi:hypothetical protein
MIVGKLSLILLCLLAIANASPYNITTGFWSEKLKYNTTFEAFAGMIMVYALRLRIDHKRSGPRNQLHVLSAV